MRKRLPFSLLLMNALFCISAAHAAPGVLPKPDVKTQAINHGVPAPVSESRGVLAVRDKNGAPFILAIARDRVDGGTRNSLLVTHCVDWKEWGAPFSPGAPLWRGADGNVYAALGKNLLQIQADFSAQKIGELPAPITVGGVLLQRGFYFASGAELWSVAVEN